MAVITLQLGQCGNQLGASLFDQLAAEYSSQSGGAYGPYAHDTFFRELPPGQHKAHPSKPWAARAVLVDMEPKVVNSVMQHAYAQQGSPWSYSSCGVLCEQSGAGNNWAQGYHQYGQRVREHAVELIRREAEACDVVEGFLLLQSMAGGTGAGLGTCVAEAVRDSFPNAHLINCCIWPYESGEVSVQPYNTLLTLSHLIDVSDGVMLFQNEALHATCTKLHSIKRPGFQDMNAVAARTIASAMLPCHARAAAAMEELPHQQAASARGGAGSKPGSSGQPLFAATAGLTLSDAPKPKPQRQPMEPQQAQKLPAGAKVHPLADLAHHLCAHPQFKLFTARAVPQMAAQNVEFTTFTWQAILKRLRQMGATGSALEEGMDWSTGDSTFCRNRSVSSMLILRGQQAGEVDVQAFQNPGLHPPWAVDPLLVTSHPARFGKCDMSATLLANDQVVRCSANDASEREDDHASSIPDSLPLAAVDTDWREFRARLIASTRAAEAGGASGSLSDPSNSREAKMTSSLWAHEISGPEKGALLLAHPQMFRTSQTYFALAVILLLDHDASGSFGVILNRPTEYNMGDLQTDIPPLQAFPRNRLFLGGDVGDTAMVVLTRHAGIEGAVEVMRGVHLCNITAAEAAVRSGVAAPSDFRFYAKYAGWGAGQLEAECKAGIWFCGAASAELALSDEGLNGRELWHLVLDNMGGDHAKVSAVVKEVEQHGRRQSQLGKKRLDNAEQP